MVELYLPFLSTYDALIERDFIALPIALAKDIRARQSEALNSDLTHWL